MRVSDSERDQVIDRLSAHAAEGRLTIEELDARIGAAQAARTGGELAAVEADLPVKRIDGPTGRPRRRSPGRWPGGPPQLAAYVAVNLVLVAIWALSGTGYFWPAWSILGWGIALLGPGPCGRVRTAPALPRAGRGAD